jgi:DNA-binding XRE family transcriptional regulator
MDDYQALIDARDHAEAMRRVGVGELRVIADADMHDYLAAATPLAFWRRKRGLTQAALASTVGISQAYLAQIETGVRLGDIHLYARLARALSVAMEALEP